MNISNNKHQSTLLKLGSLLFFVIGVLLLLGFWKFSPFINQIFLEYAQNHQTLDDTVSGGKFRVIDIAEIYAVFGAIAVYAVCRFAIFSAIYPQLSTSKQFIFLIFASLVNGLLFFLENLGETSLLLPVIWCGCCAYFYTKICSPEKENGVWVIAFWENIGLFITALLIFTLHYPFTKFQ